ncbi:hypothetical protein CI109_104564 [Kwoniella shandongensis]|uniref:Endopolyphosphatase n=1 Tax=Kwoniella shandongensis TaxID=1734106 RepID=A0AAJ8MWJ0_9TREE
MKSNLLLTLFGLTLSVASAANTEDQRPFVGPSPQLAHSGGKLRTNKKRPLKGRFLHITDIHPDPYYKTGATFDSGCHSKPKKGKDKGKGKGKLDEDGDGSDEIEEIILGKEDLAGKWGSGVSDCDTPMSLVNITFDWLKKEWAHEVDFVVWTGDNARHDIDRSLPRTPQEIFKLNRMVVSKMLDTFGTDVPIVPSIGNNDIYPHNVLAAGPSHITEEFLQIWKHFIPSDAAHVFERGAYFSQEVIPDRLAVISLNTLFWYDSNTLVDGCGDHSNDPGALEMDWLEVQLANFRQRGMQVWMTGHVPPHMGHYYDNCYLRYGDLALRYQDTIVGHLFGHMNIDHFFFIDVDELEATSLPKAEFSAFSNVSSLVGPRLHHGSDLAGSGRYRIQGRSGAQSLQAELKKDFGEMPGPRILKMKDYAVMNVAPSVIPTYYPGIRIFTYNITGVAEDRLDEDLFYRGGDAPDDDDDDDLEEDDDDMEIDPTKKRRGGHRHSKPKDDCKLPQNEDKPHCTFKSKPRHFSKHSPSRTNRPLTPLGYSQFYLPTIDKQSSHPPEWEVEYTTFKAKSLVPPSSSHSNDTTLTQPLPVPLHLLPGYDPAIFTPPAEGDNKKAKQKVKDKKKKFKKQLEKITPFRMNDLTIGNYIKLARMLVIEKKMWSKFSEIM